MKRDRLEILSPAVHVGDPLALGARVVEVEHRRHPVDTNPVDVILARPEERARLQKVAHLVAAVVEDQGAPLRVRSAEMLMLVERGPIEAGQRPVVAREVRRHPIEDHSDSLAVQVIDELLEVVRGAETRGRREVAGHLIAPRARERMLHHRHQLHVREAKIADVGGQLVSQLQVAQRPVALHGVQPPRPQVDLVDRHRTLVRLRRPPALHPLRVTPDVARAVHDRVGARHEHRPESEGIRLHPNLAALGEDLELVRRALHHARNEDLPDPRCTEHAHRVQATVPGVEVAHHAHCPRGRRPHRERGAQCAVDLAHVRPQPLVELLVAPLPGEMQIEVPERGREGIGIAKRIDVSVRVAHLELVAQRQPGTVTRTPRTAPPDGAGRA